jgi:hypothetical protein
MPRLLVLGVSEGGLRMRTPLLRKGAIATVFAMVAATLAVLVPASPAAAQTTFCNACINTAVLTDFTQLDVTLDATAPATVSPGEQFTLSGISQTLFLPGTLQAPQISGRRAAVWQYQAPASWDILMKDL